MISQYFIRGYTFFQRKRKISTGFLLSRDLAPDLFFSPFFTFCNPLEVNEKLQLRTFALFDLFTACRKRDHNDAWG